MARGLRRRTGATDRGAEAVEFALVVPFVVLLLMGVVDFGYMINRDTIVNNSSREGARQGALSPVLNDIKCRVRQSMAAVETPGTNTATGCVPGGTPKVTITITCLKPAGTSCSGTFPTDALSGGTVIVKVSYQHAWITPVGSTLIPAGLVLAKTTQMRIE